MLTVLIPCKDERHNIAECVGAVLGIADEVLIADSGSTDGTLELIDQVGGCRVVHRDYVHSGDFKNWAIPQATHEWVLIVDADERVTPELAEEIRRVLQRPLADGYWIRRDNHFLGHPIRWGNWRTDTVLRLFRRDLARYVGDTDHAEMEVAGGRVERLRGRLTHFSFDSYEQYFRKFHRYSRQQAERWYAAGRRPSFVRLLLTGPARFLQTYLLQLGVLDGWAGLQVCALTGFYSFMKQCYLWELHNARPRAAPERPAAAPSRPAHKSPSARWATEPPAETKHATPPQARD